MMKNKQEVAHSLARNAFYGLFPGHAGGERLVDTTYELCLEIPGLGIDGAAAALNLYHKEYSKDEH